MYLEMKNVNKKYGNFKASRQVSFGVEKGKLTALLGPSGSGKTTILRMIAGFEAPDEGDIIIEGKRMNDIPAARRGIGFMFQNYALFRYMTVFQNIAFGLELKKKPKQAINERVKELLALTGLEEMGGRYPAQLSGGQRQRVAFARALAPDPGLLLLDEPFAAIDAKVRQELRKWLKDMIHKVGVTSIFVTHDQDEAVLMADEIIVTNQGRIEQTGTPIEIYKHPETPFVARFIGQSAMVKEYGKLRGFEKGDYKGSIIRPEFVEAFKADNIKFKDMIKYSEEGTIEEINFRGNCLEVKLNVNGVSLTTHRSMERRPVEIGEKMRIIVYRLYAYDEERTCLLENSELKGKEVVTF